MAAHAPSGHRGRGPLYLGVVACQPWRTQNHGSRRRQDKKKLYPLTNRVTGMVQCVTFASVLPSRSSTVLVSESLLNGSPACRARYASRNESSAPESIRNISGKVSYAHNNEPSRRTCNKDRQDEIASVFWLHGAAGDVMTAQPTIQAATRCQTSAPRENHV